MVTYSHSKISCFENCPFSYKLKYIDKIEPEVPETIECFMGGIVHKTLEMFYTYKKFKKEVTKQILIDFYKNLWEKEYSKDILVVKEGLNAGNYKKMGEEYISKYFDSHKEDDMTIIGLETQDRLTLPDGNSWHVRIDKLGCKGDTYFVCDYKTNSSMKDQEEADSDRQLAMYSIWVKDKFRDAKKVILKWHMLAFDKEVTSERSTEQLKKLQEEIMNIIKKIQRAEKENDFPRNQTALCGWCGYKEMCPSFKHETSLEKKSKINYKKDEGLKLVDEYSEIKTKLAEFDKKKEEFENKLIDYAKQFDVDIIYGSNSQASVEEFDRIILPEEKEEFLALMKEKGIYDACSMICYPKISSQFKKGELHPHVAGKIRVEKDWRVGLRKRANKDGEI